MLLENSKGERVIFVFKKMKLQGDGGSYVKLLPWWGCGYFLALNILNLKYLPGIFIPNLLLLWI